MRESSRIHVPARCPHGRLATRGANPRVDPACVTDPARRPESAGIRTPTPDPRSAERPLQSAACRRLRASSRWRTPPRARRLRRGTGPGPRRSAAAAGRGGSLCGRRRPRRRRGRSRRRPRGWSRAGGSGSGRSASRPESIIATKRSKPAWKRAWNSGPTAASSTSRKRPSGGIGGEPVEQGAQRRPAALDPLARPLVGDRTCARPGRRAAPGGRRGRRRGGPRRVRRSSPGRPRPRRGCRRRWSPRSRARR